MASRYIRTPWIGFLRSSLRHQGHAAGREQRVFGMSTRVQTAALAGTKQRIKAARDVVTHFGVATECGMGPGPAESVPNCLRFMLRLPHPYDDPAMEALACSGMEDGAPLNGPRLSYCPT